MNHKIQDIIWGTSVKRNISTKTISEITSTTDNETWDKTYNTVVVKTRTSLYADLPKLL